jgi:hypothetical protein
MKFSDIFIKTPQLSDTVLPNSKVAVCYEKRGNCENYIKEAKYNMNVGSLILK